MNYMYIFFTKWLKCLLWVGIRRRTFVIMCKLFNILMITKYKQLVQSKIEVIQNPKVCHNGAKMWLKHEKKELK